MERDFEPELLDRVMVGFAHLHDVVDAQEAAQRPRERWSAAEQKRSAVPNSARTTVDPDTREEDTKDCRQV